MGFWIIGLVEDQCTASWISAWTKASGGGKSCRRSRSLQYTGLCLRKSRALLLLWRARSQNAARVLWTGFSQKNFFDLVVSHWSVYDELDLVLDAAGKILKIGGELILTEELRISRFKTRDKDYVQLHERLAQMGKTYETIMDVTKMRRYRNEFMVYLRKIA